MLALMPLLEEAGVPKGLVNVLSSRKTGALVDHMLHDPRVRVVSFTGSTEVGRKLLHLAADQVLKPAMELGGNAPVIVFEDANLDIAVEAFVDHYNHQRYHESLNNVTPSDVYFGRDKAILQQRERIKRKTLEARRLHHRQRAA